MKKLKKPTTDKLDDPDEITRCQVCNQRTRSWRLQICHYCGLWMCHICWTKHWHNDYPEEK